MFNKQRAPLLLWALGIAGAVIAAAGTGTWLFITRGRNKHEATTHTKRVATRVATKRKPATTKTYARTNHTAHHAATR